MWRFRKSSFTVDQQTPTELASENIFETSEECTCFFSRMAQGRGKLPQPTKGRSTARYSVVVAGGLLSIANQHTECHSHRCLLVLRSGSIHFTPPDFLLADQGRRRRTEQNNATLRTVSLVRLVSELEERRGTGQPVKVQHKSGVA